jgi:hypothetical protein
MRAGDPTIGRGQALHGIELDLPRYAQVEVNAFDPTLKVKTTPNGGYGSMISLSGPATSAYGSLVVTIGGKSFQATGPATARQIADSLASQMQKAGLHPLVHGRGDQASLFVPGRDLPPEEEAKCG